MNDVTKGKMLAFQKKEITEHHIYLKLAASEKAAKNKEILERIAADELRHYEIWKKYTEQDLLPNRAVVWGYFLVARILGFTFGLKLMEGTETDAQKSYDAMMPGVAEVFGIVSDEEAHEHQLIEMIDEERLKYVGSIVLGLNDALVELTGVLAGFTFALGSARLVATAGAITGIAASLSMAASEFLSTRSEGESKHPAKASVYTGFAYLLTVTLLVLPYFLLKDLLVSLVVMLGIAVAIIFTFTFYVSVAKGLNFRKRFLEMVSISLGVAGLSFLIGLGARALLNI